MSDTRPLNITHLFTIRMWAEALDKDHAEWRGQVRYVTTGTTFEQTHHASDKETRT